MVNKLKIAIAGKARAGKNTLASQFEELLGQDCKIFAFADPLKDVIMTMFPASNPEHLWGPSEYRSFLIPGTQRTFRDLLIELGAMGRRYSETVWIEAVLSRVNEYLKDHNNVLVSDLRFRNEFEILKREKFLTIRIERPDNTYNINDASETDLDNMPDSNFDYVIVNDGDLAKLRENARDFLKLLRN